MKLVVGLGNPGRRYAGTRHNIGFDVVDLLVDRHRLEWESGPANAIVTKWREQSTWLAKPLTFMNLSGQAVGDLLRFYKIAFEDLLVVVDDINLELGRLRARSRGSAGGHNGLKSLIGLLGTEEFPRLRIGVGRGDARRDLADHVTAKFEPEERTIVAEAKARGADAVETFVKEGIELVMNRFNRREEDKEEGKREKGEEEEDGD